MTQHNDSPTVESEAVAISQLEYDALLRAREGAREKDWPGDVERLQGLINRSFIATSRDNQHPA